MEDHNGVKWDDLGPIGQMWARAIQGQKECDRKFLERMKREKEDRVLLYAYVRFPTNGNGSNSHVEECIKRFRTDAGLRKSDLFSDIHACWQSQRYPDSMNLAIKSQHGAYFDAVLDWLRQSIPDCREIHQFMLVPGEEIPFGSEIPLIAHDNVVPFKRDVA